MQPQRHPLEQFIYITVSQANMAVPLEDDITLFVQAKTTGSWRWETQLTLIEWPLKRSSSSRAPFHPSCLWLDKKRILHRVGGLHDIIGGTLRRGIAKCPPFVSLGTLVCALMFRHIFFKLQKCPQSLEYFDPSSILQYIQSCMIHYQLWLHATSFEQWQW